jgi:Bacterial SH3 domain
VVPIIRAGFALLALASVASCVINPPPSSHAASAPRVTVSQLPGATASANMVWVLSTVGLNIHGLADPQSAVVTTVTQDAQLTYSEKQKVGSDTWLHVKTQSGQFEGWILDHPDLVIHRAVSLHVEDRSSWSILFPAEWSPTSGNPATFSGPSSAGGGTLLVDTDPDPTKLIATPTAPGSEVRDEGDLELYNQLPTHLKIYRLDSGGFEYAVRLQLKKTKAAFLFDFKQPPGGTQPDTTLFKQLLGSVIFLGET